MGRTVELGDNDLQISLAAPPDWTYAAGDTVIGTLVRRSPITAPDATLTLSLNGRVKTKIIITRGKTRSEYRGRWHLLGTYAQLVYQGPLHLSEDSFDILSWQFSIAIPKGPEISVVNEHFEGESFLPLDTGVVAHQPLPGTYYGSGSSGTHGFVEYYLEAALEYSHGHSKKSDGAILPITLRHPQPKKPFTNPRPKHSTVERHVRSQRVLPGMDSAELTLGQKTRKLFHSHHVPVFYFKVRVGMPVAIQIGNPAPIPLTVHILPNHNETSTVVRDNPPAIHLNWVNLKLMSNAKVLAPGNWLDTVHDGHVGDVLKLGLEKAFEKLGTPIVLPCGRKEKNHVNIGEMLQLALLPDGLYAGRKHLAYLSGLQPSFATYNIQNSHWLEWEVCLTIAGESVTVEGGGKVKIFPEV